MADDKYPDPGLPEKEAKPKRSKFPKSAEDLVEEKIFSKRTAEEEIEIELKARLAEQAEELRHKIDPEYSSKQRAHFLGSVQLEEAWSPANRVKIVTPEKDPMNYRFNHDKVRERIGDENWVPVQDMDRADKLCPSSHLRKGEDGRIYSGDSYIVERPRSEVEMRNAQIYQKSRRNAAAASGGRVTPGTPNFDRMHENSKSEDDPIGIRFTGKVKDDTPLS